MRVGLIGAGNMARAMARGWGDPVLASDSGSGRAAALASELGGRAASIVEVAREADLVVLCHKPYQLQRVANDVAGEVKAVVSVLGGITTGMIQQAYPRVPIFRMEPNTPVEVRRGILCYAPAPDVDPDLERQVLELFARLGRVVTVPEDLLGAATAALLQERGYDTLTVRREVTSPGGSTARGLDALERGGLRSAFSEAMDRVRGTT